MTDIFLDELNGQSIAELFSISVEDQTDLVGESELKDYIPAILDKIYIDKAVLETIQLGIYKNSIRATSADVPINDFYYDFFGSFRVANDVPNLLLDLSNPMSHYLRSF
jgi:hypothetical protein